MFSYSIVIPTPMPCTRIQGLEGFEYVWVITYLHLNNRHWSPLVTPPRGPRRKQGVLATRAPHRPNPIALSALRLLRVDRENCILTFAGSDLIDGTPVLDVKPYVPYADVFPGAKSGWLDELEGPAQEPDRLPYWPPPPHCRGGAGGAGCEDSVGAGATQGGAPEGGGRQVR